MRETSNGTTAVPDARVQRSALLARLAESTDVPLVVVSAGAGFGKTTLAAQWAAHDTRPHAVVRVGRFMDDPATLALHLVDALESVGADAGATRAVVTAAEPRFSAVVLPALSRLAASPTTPYVLVVDDIHLLADPDCHEVLHHVARGIPQGSQLAVLSREKLPESVARARVEGRLVDVGADGCSVCSSDPEICDGIDNDCDGQIDELLLNPCGQCIDDVRPEEGCVQL